MTEKKVVAAAVKLPSKDRVKLAKRLLASLSPARDKNEAAWIAEVQRRLQAYERGEVMTIPAEEVFRKLRARKR